MATEGYWTRRARLVIEATMRRLPSDAPVEHVRLALREAYPFGPREHYPYQIWLQLQNRALENHAAGRPLWWQPGRQRPAVEVDPNQARML